MRAVFFVLLSANLLFLAWASWIDSPRDAGEQDALAHLPRLQLVSESSGSKPVSGVPQTSEPAIHSGAPGTPEAPPADPQAAATERVAFRSQDPPGDCTSFGPFNDLASAARAAGILTQRGFQLHQRAEEGETIEGYWVFVGGMQSDDEANRLVARLAGSGLTDAHVMKNFSTNRRVSVGMFSNRQRAERRAAVVKSLGLEPEIGERRFPGTVYWVDAAASGARRLPPEYAFAEVGGGKIGSQPCPAPARPAGFPDTVPAEASVTRTLPPNAVAGAPVQR